MCVALAYTFIMLGIFIDIVNIILHYYNFAYFIW